MKNEYKIMWSGLIIQVISIVYLLLCIGLKRTVPGFVTITMFVGLFMALISSFRIRKKNIIQEQKKSNTILIFMVILVAIMLIITFIMK